MNSKKLLTVLLALVVIIASIPTVTIAKQDYDTGVMTFENYEGSWDLTQNPDLSDLENALPQDSNGEFTAYNATEFSDTNGITNGCPTSDLSNGNSIKVYYDYVESSSVYGGFKYALNEDLENVVKLEFSVFYTQRSSGERIRLRGNQTTGKTVPYIEITSVGRINLFETGQLKDENNQYIILNTGAWYDFDVWYNLNTNEYRVTMSHGNVVDFDRSGISTSRTVGTTFYRVEFMSAAALGSIGANYRVPAELYYDNIRIASEWKIPDDSENKDTDYFDFNDYNGSESNYNITTDMANLKSNTPLGKVSDKDGGTAVELNATSSSQYIIYDLTAPAERSFSYSVDFKLNDFNFKELRIQHFYNNNASKLGQYGTLVVSSSSKGVNLISQRVKADGSTSGANYEISSDKWYTLNLDYDVTTATATVSLTGDDGVYSYTINCGDDCKNISLSRIKIYYTGLVDGATSTSAVFDNMKFAYKQEGFKIVNSKSTTGPDARVDLTTPVTAVFTNKINKSSFTASSVTMPYLSNAPEMTFSFPDDYTVQLNFDKTSGVHYHIAFDGIEDVNGNVLSDYIEFDTMMPDLDMTDIQFMRDGTILALTSPGDLNAQFTAQANNGKTYDMMFTLALYSGTELCAVSSDNFTVDNTKETHTLTLKIPDDGKYYVAKAFLWDDDTLNPYIEEKTLKATTNLPVVILRFDDLKSQKINEFDEVTQWLDDYDLKASYGFMGKQILTNVSSTIRDEFDAKIIAMKNNPRIELWHHGYEDANMYEGKTIEEQRADFANCINGAYERYGIIFTAFCPPSNKLDETTLSLMNDEFTNFKVLMLTKSLEELGYENNYNFTTLSNHVVIESSSAILPLDDLKANWQEAVDAGYEYVVMYSHPASSWNKLTLDSETEYGKDTLTQFVEYLKSEGAVFMNPTEYAEYAEAVK